MTMRVLVIAGLFGAPWWLSLTGCAGDCLGTDPRCDVAWPGGRLTMVDPFGTPMVGTTDEAAVDAIWTGRIDGVVDHGTDWSADIIGQTVVIGVPDANAVYGVDVADPGRLGVMPLIEGTRRFGEIVRVVAEREGNTLWVGAPGAEVDRGALYRYPRVDRRVAREQTDPDDLSAGERDLEIRGLTENDRLGANVEVCIDIDGDGVRDLVLGVPTFQAADACGMAGDPPPNLAGAVFVLKSRELGGPASSRSAMSRATSCGGPRPVSRPARR